jgi:hypothetical protein
MARALNSLSAPVLAGTIRLALVAGVRAEVAAVFRAWAEDAGLAGQLGAGLKQDDPRHAAEWLREWLDDGTLAAAAWSGYVRLPKFGTPRIVELMRTL